VFADAVGTRVVPAPLVPMPLALERPPYVVGIVNYHSYEDLDRCLVGVKSQTVRPHGVIVVDVEPEDALHRATMERHPEATFLRAPNRGFGAGANLVLRHEFRPTSPVEYVLILNPDVELRPSFARELVDSMTQHPNAALASGKLLRRDGRTIDSAGIVLPRHRHPRDRGSEQRDLGQYDQAAFLFGVSGCAVMIRRAAADDLNVLGEVFDEDFFLYHEDSDLCWRANLLGWRVLYVPSAEALHGRRWQRVRRFKIPPHVRRHSFKNHYLSMLKNERVRDLLRNLPIVLAWEVARLGYALLRDRPVLGGYREALRRRRRILRKRRLVQREAARRRRLAAGCAVVGPTLPHRPRPGGGIAGPVPPPHPANAADRLSSPGG
jgi:GT2 family glycosyltransferase